MCPNSIPHSPKCVSHYWAEADQLTSPASGLTSELDVRWGQVMPTWPSARGSKRANFFDSHFMPHESSSKEKKEQTRDRRTFIGNTHWLNTYLANKTELQKWYTEVSKNTLLTMFKSALNRTGWALKHYKILTSRVWMKANVQHTQSSGAAGVCLDQDAFYNQKQKLQEMNTLIYTAWLWFTL